MISIFLKSRRDRFGFTVTQDRHRQARVNTPYSPECLELPCSRTTLGCRQGNSEYARTRRKMFPRGEPTGHCGFIDYHLG
ncbi:MAG: hypothetical protein ACRDTG_00580 [Pseudonocardiaceae bacterium]